MLRKTINWFKKNAVWLLCLTTILTLSCLFGLEIEKESTKPSFDSGVFFVFFTIGLLTTSLAIGIIVTLVKVGKYINESFESTRLENP